MKRFPREVYLTPSGKEDLDNDLAETFAEVAQTTEWIQAPPCLIADLAAADQVMPVNVATLIGFQAGTDTHGWYDNTLYRYTPKETGFYQLSLQVTLEYATGLANAGNIRIGLRNSGTNIATIRADPESTGTITRSYTLSRLVKLNGATEYLDVSVNYDAGTGLTVLGAIARTFLTVHWVGGEQMHQAVAIPDV